MIHVVIGTKAQLIKMAPVIREVRRRNLPTNLVFTGQHVAGMEELRSSFRLPPWDHHLAEEPNDVTGVLQMLLWGLRCMLRFFRSKRRVFPEPGVVLIHGDTMSTLMGGLMGRWLGWKVVHVEAGLRSFDLLHPFPEELVRRIVCKLSDVHLAPGEWALGNLRNVGGVAFSTGENTLLDSLRLALADDDAEPVEALASPYAIATIHRFENVFSRKALRRIVKILLEISREIRILFILHKPTERNLRRFGLYEDLEACDRIELRDRYSYFPFVRLMSRARFVISDGGSNQEECSYSNVPCLLLRRRTERMEGLEQNVCLSGFDPQAIQNFLRDIDRWKGRTPRPEASPSSLVADVLEKQLQEMVRTRQERRK